MWRAPRAGSSAKRASSLGVALSMAMGLALALAPLPASAHRHHHRIAAARSPTDPTKDAALIMDGETGKILYARNPDALRYPASLTKMMTLYLLFDAMQKGQVTLQTPLTVSAHSAAQSAVKLYMKPGDSITVEQAIKAIVVRSANDVAVTIAENLGGSEPRFAEMMTEKAHALGMSRTQFVNASGLPNRGQISSAADLGLLARHLAYDYPQYFHYFSTPSFTFRGRTWETHDNLIGNYQGADGIKTGYTVMSGFNLVSSVVRDGAHIIGVVMGGRTARTRDTEMVRLLNNTFGQIQSNPTLVARATVPWQAIAQGGRSNTVIAGFDLGESRLRSPQWFQSPADLATPQLRPGDAADPNDEDAAEVSSFENLDDQALAPKPAPRPAPVLATYQPQDMPAKSSADTSAPTKAVSGKREWTVQIGAFASATLARAQLTSYAEKSTDVLRGAPRVVSPFQTLRGHTLYRARFGPFAERDARKVCARMTERGQTCFAAIVVR